MEAFHGRTPLEYSPSICQRSTLVLEDIDLARLEYVRTSICIRNQRSADILELQHVEPFKQNKRVETSKKCALRQLLKS